MTSLSVAERWQVQPNWTLNKAASERGHLSRITTCMPGDEASRRRLIAALLTAAAQQELPDLPNAANGPNEAEGA